MSTPLSMTASPEAEILDHEVRKVVIRLAAALRRPPPTFADAAAVHDVIVASETEELSGKAEGFSLQRFWKVTRNSSKLGQEALVVRCLPRRGNHGIGLCEG